MMRIETPEDYLAQCRADFVTIFTLGDEMLRLEFGCSDSFVHYDETRQEIMATIALRAPVQVAEIVVLLAARDDEAAREALRALIAAVKEADPALFRGNVVKDDLVPLWLRTGAPWAVARANAGRADLKTGRHFAYEASHQWPEPYALDDLPPVPPRESGRVDGGHVAHSDLAEVRARLAARLPRASVSQAEGEVPVTEPT